MSETRRKTKPVTLGDVQTTMSKGTKAATVVSYLIVYGLAALICLGIFVLGVKLVKMLMGLL